MSGKITADRNDNKVTVSEDVVTVKVGATLPSTLNTLTDVTIVSPVNGELLVYNATLGIWENNSAGAGDMLKSVYDPTNIADNAFDMDNMVESSTAKILTDVERLEIASNTLKVSYTDAADVTLNTSARHTHSNKAVLDLVTAAFTTNDETKLDGIETGATADQTGAEIKIAYEAELDTNAFTDSEKSDLALNTTNRHSHTNKVNLDVINQDLATSDDVDFNSLTIGSGEQITWNSTYKTIEIPTGYGNSVKVGKDTTFPVHNATGAPLLKGTVVYPTGTSTNGVSNVDKAIANSHETLTSLIGFIVEDIADGSVGEVMVQGILELDTSSVTEGLIYLSKDTAGAYTNTKPEFPDYDVLIGVVDKANVNGLLTVDINFNLQNTLTNFWNGVFRESFDFTVDSNGTVITGSLAPSNGHPNMTMLFSDGFSTLDTTPAATITLIAGTDAVPQMNYVYILKSTKNLTVSTSGWPTAEHIKVADLYLRSATATQSDDALVNRNWNDHIESTTTFQGHLSHITEKLRLGHANWVSGANGVCTTNGTNVYVSVTSGIIYQLHQQTFPALDSETGDAIHIINDTVAPYSEVTDLGTLTLDASGNSLLNSSFSLVLWGVANKTGETSHLMLNLPTDTYSRLAPENAVNDADNNSVYDIPDNFKGKGFLIARFTYQLTSVGSWTLYDTQDLRGKTPNTTAGGGAAGAGVTELTALTDVPSSYIGQTGKTLVVNAGETGMEFQVAGSGDVLGPASAVGDNLASYNLTTGKIIKDSGIASSNVFNKSVDNTDDIVQGNNKFTTTAEITKLSGIEDNATANSSDATLLARANHTGAQTASTISDFDTEVSNNVSVVANTNKNTYPSSDATKVGFITVSQIVNLDIMEGDIATNNDKISATGNELESSDINTLSKLNGIVADATLINTTDSRLSDARTPLAHTHTEADITDLGSYIANVVDDTTPQLGGDLDAQDKNISGLATATFTQELDLGTKTASFTVDFGTDQKQKCTLTANTMTITLDTTNVEVGNYQLTIINGGLATITWASETGTIAAPSGTAPVLTSSGEDIVSMYYNGTNWRIVASLDFQTL